MIDDLAEIEEIAGALLRKVSAGERRRILRAMARTLQRSQSARIARQQNPDGSAYIPRRKRKPPAPGAYTAKFLYPRGAAHPRLVLMKSWTHEGNLLTGFDIEAGGIRSFFWNKVDRWLPVDPSEQNKSGGTLRRRGSVRRAAMFRKLRQSRQLQQGATDRELWVGFSGRAADIARISQEGLTDRPSAKSQPVRYPKRKLLGVSDAERSRMLDLLLQHISD